MVPPPFPYPKEEVNDETPIEKGGGLFCWRRRSLYRGCP